VLSETEAAVERIRNHNAESDDGDDDDEVLEWEKTRRREAFARYLLCCGVLCCAVVCYAMLCCGVLCYAVVCYAMLCCAVVCYAMLWCAMLCYAVVRYAMLWCAMLCFGVLCYAMLCCGVLCCAMLCCGVLCYALVWCAMMWCGVLCYAVVCYAMLCCGVLCCGVVWCGLVLCYMLCCTMPYHTIHLLMADHGTSPCTYLLTNAFLLPTTYYLLPTTSRYGEMNPQVAGDIDPNYIPMLRTRSISRVGLCYVIVCAILIDIALSFNFIYLFVCCHVCHMTNMYACMLVCFTNALPAALTYLLMCIGERVCSLTAARFAE
jgi:hypothetical protein